jgi:hypothetical protein
MRKYTRRKIPELPPPIVMKAVFESVFESGETNTIDGLPMFGPTFEFENLRLDSSDVESQPSLMMANAPPITPMDSTLQGD